MNFDLKTPCKDCPFRTDIKFYLRPNRVREILDGITDGQQTFACHKTTIFDDDGETINSPKEQHCAGATILLEKIERPNQWMRISERLGFYDRRKLDMDAPVFDSPEEMLESAEA